MLPLYWELKTKRRMALDFTYKIVPGIPQNLLHEGTARVFNDDKIAAITAGYIEDVSTLIAQHLGAKPVAPPGTSQTSGG